MKKMILVLALLTTTLTTSAATAQTEEPAEAPTEAVEAETDTERTVATPDLEAAQPATAPERDAEPKQSEPTSKELRADAEEIESLVRAGKWFAALGALLILLVAVFRKWIFGKVAWFQTKQGGYTAAGGLFLATVIGLSIKTGFSIDVIMAGLVASGFASGLHTVANDLKSG